METEIRFWFRILIIQQNVKKLLSSRLRLFLSSSNKKKLFCFCVFRRKKRAGIFKNMSRNNRAPSVDTPNYNGVITSMQCESSFIYEWGCIELEGL